MRRLVLLTVVSLIAASSPFAIGQTPAAAGEHRTGHLKHVEFDLDKKQVRVECEALGVNAPLEFFCCVRGTNEHESVLRTEAKPSDIQIGMLAIGLKPGAPITFNQGAQKWIPPHGPPLHITVEFEKDGKTVSYPGYRWLRNLKTRQEPKAFTWVYAGSRIMPDGKFAADVTGYVVSIVNFDLTMIDVPELASSNNETLEWERNADLMPKTGTKVWMVIEPAGKDAGPPTNQCAPEDQKAAPAEQNAASAADSRSAGEGQPLSPVKIDEQRVKELRAYWESKVSPNAAALKQAAEAHYEVIASLRREQQRLVEEADRIQRAIDQIEKEYQDLTTPHPKGNGS